MKLQEYHMTTILWQLVSFILLAEVCNGMIEEIRTPTNIQNCYNRYSRNTRLTRSVGDIINWICVQRNVIRAPSRSDLMLSNASYTDLLWWNDLVQSVDPMFNIGKPRGPIRIRKEYRRLSDMERFRFHAAIKTLKQIPFCTTNRYDFIAGFHSGSVIPRAHGGPAFLTWHRVYLLLFENALRQIDPSVAVPYWDSRMDQALDDPTESIIFSDEFLGNGNGEVTSGPFKKWKTVTGPLIRNIGDNGELFNQTALNRVLSKCRLNDISQPNIQTEFDFDAIHGGIHRWVGGNLNDINASSTDPLFFLHHAMTDYVFELFQQGAKRQGIDTETDWPENFGEEQGQAPYAKMGFGETMLNIHGRSDYFTGSVYLYEASPTCSFWDQSCNSPYLYCSMTTGQPRCVSKTRRDVNGRSQGQSASCSNQRPRGIQNNFYCDGTSDIRQWAYIPVEIIHYRPPGKTMQSSFPVFNGQVVRETDIYSPRAYNNLQSLTRSDNPAMYNTCERGRQNVETIRIETTGINYDGTYEDVAIADSRLAISRSITYVGIKNPDRGMSEAMITAADSCGCVCKPYCRNFQTNSFRQCSGAIRVTSNYPKLYGYNYGESITSCWNLPGETGSCPSFSQEQVFVRFLCDFPTNWIWNSSDLADSQQQRPTQQQGLIKPFSASNCSPITIQYDQFGKTYQLNGCQIEGSCIVEGECQCTEQLTAKPCMFNPSKVALCNGGTYFLQDVLK